MSHDSTNSHRWATGSPERVLVDLAQQGDEEAFRELVSQVRQRCVHIAMAILGNRDDAEEEVQNAMWKAYTHLQSFNCQSKFSTWVTRIVVNQCLMRSRRGRRLRFVAYDSTSADGGSYAAHEPTDAETPEHRVGRNQVISILREELRQIPILLRTPVDLYFLQGRSLEEVAATLGISVAATKSRLHRAQTFLRDRMLRHCGCRGAATLTRVA